MSGECDFSALIGDFVEDAGGHLDAVEGFLLELERRAPAGCDGELVTLIQGHLHTLKGNSGMMGLSPLQQYVHRLEEVMKETGAGTLTLGGALFGALYGGINALRSALFRFAQTPDVGFDFAVEEAALEALRAAPHSVTRASAEATSEGTPEPLPSRSAAPAEFGYITQKSSTLKVNFEKLDELLNLMGELVIQRTALATLEKRLREQVSDRELLNAFNETSQLIGKSTDDLRQSIMKVRMLPVKSVFQRFQRLVRDLSLAHGKEVRLKLEGEETELDKTVLDEIGEPLLHLIRNAVDHGLETPAERRARGKEACGTLTLRARHESNHIVIQVCDDGRGMDPEEIRKKAVARGVLEQEAAQAMSEAELLQLVFVPGFSTRSEVTETSGRGIGLDVVKKIVSSLNGIIEIESRVGRGTTFTMMLPLTLAIISALMVEVAGETYAVPLSGVLESVQVQGEECHDTGNGEVIMLRDRVLPLYRLDRFFGRESGGEREQEYVVVVASGDKKGGLVVDRLVGQQEIVIKGLDDYLGELPGISGGTVLGDGRVSLIVDIPSILGR
ncbi:chemotaxis protein CheA [Geomonas nitrogeniifigens]|uniref:chemotaxis protein CheA n=1 Tax=Geomonas diazotrophica TaxID=2843197 RepID=UPI001C2CAF59|nr:chemotaxis protein CheA [Geomonas nitrogeniifigens]QXE85435.1 chemotaxis protein CheA [Geomonas nitrogeniifigens]